MKKRMTAFITALTMLLSTGAVLAENDTEATALPTAVEVPDNISAALMESGTCGDNLTWVLQNGTLTISGTDDMTDWERYSDIPWYSDRESIKNVVINDGVTSIGKGAFSGCSSLSSITLPNSVTSIGGSAFEECCSLNSITIPNGVTSIGDHAFGGCSSLSSIVIPDSVTSIGGSAFEYCSSLSSITLPNSVESIGDSAFLWCSSLTDITVEKGNVNYSSLDGVLFDKLQTTIIAYPSEKKIHPIPFQIVSQV